MQTMQALVMAHPGMRCAYFSNEECVEQLAFTAKRIGATDIMADNISDIDTIARLMLNLDLIVLDSYPGLTSEEFSQPKALEQHTLTTIIKAAKATGCIVIFVMHCTKTGAAAGSKNIPCIDTCITISKMDADLVVASAAASSPWRRTVSAHRPK
jgi:predicted ATP-dependent serine protease